MSTIEKLRERAQNSDYMVHNMNIRQEMFYAEDLKVTAFVILDNYPVGNNEAGNYHTEMFRMFGPCNAPLSYKRTSWKKVDGSPLPELSELVAVLDLELRAFLLNRFNAELYDLAHVDFPRAIQVVTPWWRRLFTRIKQEIYGNDVRY